MANPILRLDTNVEGEFFVDSSCINCDTCRQLAPNNFAEDNDYSFVMKQPESDKEILQSMQAVIACPTGSIGHDDKLDRRTFRETFPIQLDTKLYYLGYHSPKSYGGASYLLQQKDGNWMIDSPRYSTHLREKIKELGGVKYIFLTHQDDVADADKYARDFDAKRIIHRDDRRAQPDSEIIIEGDEEKMIDDVEDIIIIPTPGHTRGHMCLLAYDSYLFTGDHLYWREDLQGLRASRRMNWYSWKVQKESLHLLANYSFEWILPGHGKRIQLNKDEMKVELNILLEKIEKSNYW